MSAATISNIKCMAKVFELFFRYRLELSLSETVVQCEASEAQIKPILEKLTKREWLLFSKTKKTYRYGMNTKSRTRTTVHPDYETAFHCLQSEHNASFS